MARNSRSLRHYPTRPIDQQITFLTQDIDLLKGVLHRIQYQNYIPLTTSATILRAHLTESGYNFNNPPADRAMMTSTQRTSLRRLERVIDLAELSLELMKVKERRCKDLEWERMELLEEREKYEELTVLFEEWSPWHCKG